MATNGSIGLDEVVEDEDAEVLSFTNTTVASPAAPPSTHKASFIRLFG
jgi:hypothetical protein